MKRKRERIPIDRIAAVLKQAELGAAAGDSVGEPGMSERTCYGRRRRYAGLQSRQLKELRQLHNENQRLKKLVTKLRLEKSILENSRGICSAYKRHC